MTNADQRRSAADRELPLRARGDLQAVEVAFAGQATFVVTDPVAGESFNLSAEEHALLAALRRPTSLRALQRILETQFAPRRATIHQLQHFVNQLYDQGLLVGENPGQGAELHARGRRRARRGRWANWLSLLAVRLGGIDAAPVVDRLYRAFGWLCSPPVLMAAGVLVAAAACMAIGQAPELAAKMPSMGELAAARLLPAWILAIVCVKVLHELGHALACRHFGARPQEMGVLLLAGAPSLYCDVSDAWRLPSKWQRMAVSSAGMAVEAVIAALAVIVWRYAEPGLLSAVCLGLIIVCSVGTLLVNANPLLRYDGYYLMADWLEIPNLAERARGLVGGAWRHWLLGDPLQADPLLTPRKRRGLWVYAILSKAYLALVLAGLFVVLLAVARPYHLDNAVYTLAVFILATLLARPVIAASKLLANPAVRGRFRWLRLGATLAVLGGAAVGVLMLPVTRRVTAPIVAMPAHWHPLFAVAAGELTFAVDAGTSVEAGDVVARLRNPELELAISAQAGAVREKRLRLEQLRTLQSSIPGASRDLPAAAAELADAEAQLAEQQAMAEELVIRAPAAGRVAAAPERVPDRLDGEKLSPWSGSPLEARNTGAWIEPGTPLAVIVEPGGWVAWAGVPQADVTSVEAGQSVRLMADVRPAEILTGRVTQVSRQARRNRAAGDAAAPAAAQDWGDASYHVVEIALDDAARPLVPRARGTAKIDATRTTVGALVLNQLRRTFRRVF